MVTSTSKRSQSRQGREQDDSKRSSFVSHGHVQYVFSRFECIGRSPHSLITIAQEKISTSHFVLKHRYGRSSTQGRDQGTEA